MARPAACALPRAGIPRVGCGEFFLRRVQTKSLPAAPLSLARAAAAGGGENQNAVSTSAAAEPKWKQKLAAAEEHAQQTRMATARLQEEYRQRQEAERRAQARGSGGVGGVAEAALSSLPWVAYLTEEGKIVDCSQEGAKASVYAIFDHNRVVQYVGVSRQVYQSLRLHFARCPQLCHWVKVWHFTKPSRAALEGVRDQWISESGGKVPGNDGGVVQHRWENPVDCKPLMTDAEREAVEVASPGPPKAKALKEVARRVERELQAAFEERQCQEVLRFDPKLKESCQLDLKSTAYAPDTSVPSAKQK